MNDDLKTISGSRWGVVAIAVLAGIIAAGHVGKLPPLLPMIREDLGIGMVFGGWIVSTFAFVGAVSAPFIGALADRIGIWRTMVIGLLLVGGGSIFGAQAVSGWWLLASRVVEGFGFLAVAVSAPSVIASVTDVRNRRFALGLWGTYMPTGMTLCLLAAPPIAGVFGWRGTWVVAAVVAIAWLAAIVAAMFRAPLPASGTSVRVLSNLAKCARLPSLWLLAAGFALYTLPWSALMVWLPTFLTETRAMESGPAAALTAAVVICNVPGNLIGGWLLRRGSERWVLMAAASITMALSGLGIFSPFLPDVVRFGLCLVFSGVGGLLPISVLNGAPAFAPSRQSIGAANGMLVQGSNTGLVLGPPLVAWAVTTMGGWHGAMAVIIATCLLGIAVSLAVRQFERGTPSPSPL